MKDSIGALIARFSPVLMTLILSLSSYWISLQAELDLFGNSSVKDPNKIDYFFSTFFFEKHDRENQSILVLQGKSAEHIPGPATLTIDKPYSKRLQADGPAIQLSGNQGVYQTQADILDISGDVQIDREDGLKMMAKSVRSNNNTGILSSTEETIATEPGQNIRMTGFEYDYQQGYLSSEGNVSLTLEAKQP